jgi:mRNA-degrading endonuclease YafQ of YafQ-DinJ toxin-antitoxin module
MLSVAYTPKFVRAYKKLVPELKQEVKRAIEDFKNPSSHERLRVHKLAGPSKDRHSFSVNYSTRIVFTYLKKDSALLLIVGDHEVYR